MLRIVLFCIFAPLAAMEMLFYHHFGLVIVGTLYIGLSMQADFAAARFIRDGLCRDDTSGSTRINRKPRHWSDDDPGPDEADLKVHPLGETRRSTDAYRPRPPESAPQAPRIAALLPEREVPRAREPRTERRRTEARPLPPCPNFRGRAHEVLGVDENAATRTIVNAFRHWIKCFHPDRAPALPMELANAKVRQLTASKVLLLERRRSRKAA